MANRVSPYDVQQILDTDMDVFKLTAFITGAHLMVNRLLANQDYSAEELFEIERWLSAHFATAREKQIKSESFGGASETYDTMIGKGLDSSIYGQQVKLLDTEGILAGRERRRAQVTWIGNK